MHRTIQVQILDRKFPLRIHEDNEDLMRSIASYVDQKMRSVAGNLPDRPDLTIAVIAALSIAEELYAERARSPISVDELNDSLESLVGQIADVLDSESTER